MTEPQKLFYEHITSYLCANPSLSNYDAVSVLAKILNGIKKR